MHEDAHELMPPEIGESMPALYATEHEADPIARVKWFTPDSNWTWYVTEYDPASGQCFGLVDGFEQELGYFDLYEIKRARGPLGLRVERDLHFTPCKLSEVRR